MNRDDLVEFVEWILFDGNDGAVVSGVVDEDIDSAEFLFGGGDDAFAIGAWARSAVA